MVWQPVWTRLRPRDTRSPHSIERCLCACGTVKCSRLTAFISRSHRIMAIRTFQAEVSAVKDLTHDVRELELTLREPRELFFKAGQFISFEVPKEGLPYPLTRPYSIASSPSSPHRITLVFN